ncbi:Crp/Fnr family transcriptional regulator [Sphingobium sp.]|uniref:Crp/Fnr family transcriptional regulator n=1 Tax=Sphingobium sp. TaxID=1912891 RepID=UPI002CE179E0|nr:Crp/Fnr family transcriptional regulator [Sphingobium sp.]HUD95325.1 Crp/Fnr family transcriptional regulator [Sphingobium sp.]
MIDRHIAKLRARDELSSQEEDAIRAAVAEVRIYEPDLTVIRRAEQLTHSTLLLDGFMCRYKDLSDGQRQISELHVSGDFVDLHSFTLKYLDHDIMTLTPCRVALVPHEKLQEITEQHPHLARLYWFLTNIDAAVHREWELSLGRRSAVARIAHLFCELQVRLCIVGMADDRGFELPLTQAELAECSGLTAVHVNRSLKALREDGLVEFRRSRVELRSLEKLRMLAEFDPMYLYVDRRRR